MRVANNVIALNITNNMNKTDRKLSLSMGRLSSGVKLNRAKDDAAGYAISTRLNMQIQGYTRGSENAHDAVSLIQTAESSLASIDEMLQRSRELAVQAANDTYTEEDKKLMQDELSEYLDEIDSVVKKASFNGIEFLNGRAQRTVLNESTDDLSSITYVSSKLPAGEFSYYIDKAGTQASYTSTYDSSQTISEGGELTINGSTITFEEGESADSVYKKILSACDSNNLSFDVGTGKFTTYEYGSEYSINVSGDDSVLADLGFTATADPSASVGTDAKISSINYISSADGSTVVYNPTISINGNHITLDSLNNQTIEIEVKAEASGTYKQEITDGGQLNIQLGGNSDAVLGLYIPKINTETLGVEYVNISTHDGAERAIGTLDDAIEKVSTVRATLGAYENRLEYSASSLDTANEASTVSLSRIRDTDMALEMANYTKENVIFQAATSILAQANQRPQLILQLIS